MAGALPGPMGDLHIPKVSRVLPGPAGKLQQLAASGALHTATPDALGLRDQRSGSVMNHQGSLLVLQNGFRSQLWDEARQALEGAAARSGEHAQLMSIAAARALGTGKLPRLLVLLGAVTPAGDGAAFAKAKDPSGALGAALHASALAAHAGIGPGAVLLLRDVSVFSPVPGAAYLAVTASTVQQVWSAHGQQQAAGYGTLRSAASTQQRTPTQGHPGMRLPGQHQSGCSPNQWASSSSGAPPACVRAQPERTQQQQFGMPVQLPSWCPTPSPTTGGSQTPPPAAMAAAAVGALPGLHQQLPHSLQPHKHHAPQRDSPQPQGSSAVGSVCSMPPPPPRRQQQLPPLFKAVARQHMPQQVLGGELPALQQVVPQQQAPQQQPWQQQQQQQRALNAADLAEELLPDVLDDNCQPCPPAVSLAPTPAAAWPPDAADTNNTSRPAHLMGCSLTSSTRPSISACHDAPGAASAGAGAHAHDTLDNVVASVFGSQLGHSVLAQPQQGVPPAQQVGQQQQHSIDDGYQGTAKRARSDAAFAAAAPTPQAAQQQEQQQQQQGGAPMVACARRPLSGGAAGGRASAHVSLLDDLLGDDEVLLDDEL